MPVFFIALLVFLSSFSHAQDSATPAAEVAKPYVTIMTTQGDIVLELHPEKAPITVANFLAYIKSDFYKGSIFHRVIDGFMIQGGGFSESMLRKSPQKPIKNEADNGLFNNRGAITMARTVKVDSATSQFFINLKNNYFLNHGHRDFGYAVFGNVISGMRVVDAIGQVDTGRVKGMADVPLHPVVIVDVVVSYTKP
ncbi:MAG: peptidylprolyl isomerase [Bermanella sp.]|jgi:Peptidyl-prolyl cis-trans isomerase (rotamase) - cyclophilin family